MWSQRHERVKSFWAQGTGPSWFLLRFCGGLYLDIKRKLPWFPSDFYEGFHIQSISAILFIYLGCITNAITFGGLLGDATDNYQVKSKGRWSLWLGDSGMGWDGMGFTLLVPCQALTLEMEIRCQVGLAVLKYLQNGKTLLNANASSNATWSHPSYTDPRRRP